MTDAAPPEKPAPRRRRRPPAKTGAPPPAAAPTPEGGTPTDPGATAAASAAGPASAAAGESGAAVLSAESPATESLGAAAATVSGGDAPPGSAQPAEPEPAAQAPVAPVARGGPGARRPSRWRSAAVVTMLILASVLTPVSVAGIWLRNQIFDENTYVDTVAPLSSDPAIQNAVADYITFQIFSHLDVQAKAEQILPPALDPLAAPLAAAVQSFTAGKVHDVVTSSQFSVVWAQANRIAHQHVINFLLGRPGNVGVSGGKLVINTRPLLDLVVQKLQASGVSFISQLPLDKIDTSLVIGDASGLARAQDQLRLLQGVTIVLPFLTLALYAGAIALARDRRRAVLFAAAGAAVGSVVLGVALAFGRGAYLDSVIGPHLPQDAAAALYDTMVRFLKDANRALFAFALVVMAGAFLSGPSRSAVSVRAGAARLLDAARGRGPAPGWTSSSVGVWVGAHRGLLRIAVVILAAIILIFWDRPSALVVLFIALGALLAIGVIEFLGGRRPAPLPTPAE